MALGHALLHPGRLREALAADARADAFGASVDAALGLAGHGDFGPAAGAWAEGLTQRLRAVGEAFTAATTNGPLAQLLAAPPGDAAGLQQRLGLIVDAAAALDADGLRRAILSLLDGLLAALPELRMPDLQGSVKREIDAALGILEQPLKEGRRDAAAHRSYRTAAEIRRRLNGLQIPLPPRVAALELKSWLRGEAERLLAALDAPALRAMVDQIARFKGEFGGLFDAASRLEVRITVSAGGPQGQPRPEPDFRDDAKAQPFPVGHALWWLDLITNTVAWFNLLWEMIRTRNFTDRWLDGIASVLLLAWQTVRLVVRAGWPEDMSGWSSGAQWVFSDQGDFVLANGLRFLMNFHEAGSFSNWIGTLLIRALKHVTAVSQPRALYQLVRSIWYLDSWKNRPEGDTTAPSFIRVLWAIWGPWWFCSSLGGMFPSWDDFHLEGLQPSAIASLIVSQLVGIGLALYIAWGQFDWTAPAGDTATKVVMAAFTGLTLFLVAGLLSDVESDSTTLAWVLFVIAAVLLVALFIATFAAQDSAFASYALILLNGLICAGLIPFALWWVYIDDGRDKPGVFEGLDAATSPYRLPYPRGENWLCGQGTHGIFSHHTYSEGAPNDFDDSNHYAYDFNESEGKQILAARDGVVIQALDPHPNRQQNANFFDVLHLDWRSGHDPGTEEERVLSWATYFHVAQHSVAATLGQPVAQGQHIAKCDSTGRSAQHHIHLSAQVNQGGRDRSVPMVFQDDSVRGFRHYPLLAWIGGKGHIPGKPVAYAHYTSDNAPLAAAASPVAPLSLALDEGGVAGAAGHWHRLVVPAAAIAGAADPVVVFAEARHGHSHRVLITRAALDRIRRGDRPFSAEGITVDPAPDGHGHTILPRAIGGTRDILLATKKGSTGAKHQHWVTFRLDRFLDATPAAGTTVTSGGDFDDQGNATAAPHTHDVTVTLAGLRALIRGEDLPEGGMSVVLADGHRHEGTDGSARPRVTSLPSLSARIVAPPTARLAAETPGPYRLMGAQGVLRADGRACEAWLAGAHRPELAADVPVERGLATTEPVTIVGAAIAPAADARGSPRLAATALSDRLAAQAGARRHVAVAALPVLVIETRRRGNAARLGVDAATSPLFGLAAGTVSGAGTLADLHAPTPAALAAAITAGLTAPWPAAPANGAQAFTAAGPAIDHTLAGARNRAVLTAARDAAGTGLIPAGPLPLHPGPVGVTPTWAVPLLAAPAMLRLDLGHASLSGAAREATPLRLTVSGGPAQDVTLDGAATAEAIARRIMLRADGVRAWAEGATTVVVATVAGGSAVSLAIAKDHATPLALGPVSGRSATLTGGTSVADSAAVPVTRLREAAADAAGRAAALPYDPAAVQPAVTVQGNRLRFATAAGHTVALVAEGTGVITGATPAAQSVDSDPLPATLTLPGSSWADVTVNGHAVRAPLTGEPARIEIGPLPRLPRNGERLVLDADGTPLTVTFDGTQRSLEAVAERILAAMDAAAPGASPVRLRFAWSIRIGNTLHGAGEAPGTLRLAESDGLGLLGFLRDRAALREDADGVFGDHLAAGTDEPVSSAGGPLRRRLFGPPSSLLTLPAADPPRLEAPAGHTITVRAPAAPPAPITSPPGAANVARVDGAGPFPFAQGAATWRFEVADGGGTIVAEAIGQLAASPAALRATAAPVAQGNAALPLTIVLFAPGEAAVTAEADLRGVTDATDAAQRILRALPGLRAFAVLQLDGQRVLHVETVGRGTGWSLRLRGRAALLALGFRPPGYDLAIEEIAADGGGTVVNAAAVTLAELRAMLARTLATATGPPAQPPLYTLAAAGGTLTLARPGGAGAPSLTSTPPVVAAALGAAPGPGGLVVGAGPHASGDGLLRVTAGEFGTTAIVAGRQAELRAPDPVPADGTPDATAQLAFLAANGLAVTVDGTPRPVPPAPGGLATVADAVTHIARHIAPGWAGLRADPGAGPGAQPHLVLRGAVRGTAGRIDVTFPAAPPLPGGVLLGFTGNAGANGLGVVRDAGALPATGPDSIETLLTARGSRPDAPQALYRAVPDAAAGVVRLRPNGARTVLRVTTTPPWLAAVAVPADGSVTVTTGPAIAVEPGVLELSADRPDEARRVVTVPFWGRPARLPPLALPTGGIGGLAGRTLVFSIGGGPATTVTLPGTDLGEIAARIARDSGWALRALPTPAGLVIETIAEGDAIRLSLTGGTALGADPAADLVAPAALPIEARGAGAVPDLAAATPAQIAAALDAGLAERDPTLDAAVVGTARLDAAAYGPDQRQGSGLVVESSRIGVAGRLEWNTAAAVGAWPVWDMSLSRGPAQRAAVVLGPFAAPISPNGDLPIGFDENLAADLPARRTVTVTFDGTALAAAGIAARIDAALRVGGAGAAAAWPDGRVVVETATSGLAGTVRIPAQGAPRGVADALVGAGAERFARGWPGAGRAVPLREMSAGFRGVRTAAAEPASYVFTAGGTSTAPVAVAAGMDADAAAAQIDAAFAAAGRIGIAAVVDGALCIEATDPANPLDVTIGGAAPAASPTPRGGDTAELVPDAGFDLRRTDLVRTVNLARAPTDDARFAGRQALGWLRVPTTVPTPPPATGPAVTPGAWGQFPLGRYLAVARPEAARAGNAADPAALRTATASAAAPPVVDPATQRAQPLVLRYWVSLTAGGNEASLRGASAAGPEPLAADLLTWR
jgi:murein DD-endopeptidase MepM/ murein hydrolase activator NlpD